MASRYTVNNIGVNIEDIHNDIIDIKRKVQIIKNNSIKLDMLCDRLEEIYEDIEKLSNKFEY